MPASLPAESINGTHGGDSDYYYYDDDLKRESGSLHRGHGNGPSFRILHACHPSLSY